MFLDTLSVTLRKSKANDMSKFSEKSLHFQELWTPSRPTTRDRPFISKSKEILDIHNMYKREHRITNNKRQKSAFSNPNVWGCGV